MGIPGLYRYILDKYKSVHYWINHENISHLYIDFNPLIYKAYELVKQHHGSDRISSMSKGRIEHHIIETVLTLTTRMICEVAKPTQLVYIAIDGPAPRCKMHQQRCRRYKKIYEASIRRMVYEKHGRFDADEVWDTSNITPGSEFMYNLNRAMKGAIRQGRFTQHAPIQVIFSGSDVPGEGEHKFLHHLESLPSNLPPSNEDKDQETAPNGTHPKICIFSNDGDLLILGNRFPDKDIILLTNPNKSSRTVKTLYPTHEYIYVSINRFQQAIIHNLKLENYDQERIIRDFIFFTMLGGNDFVQPIIFAKMRYRHTLPMLLDIYHKVFQKHQNYMIYKYTGDTPGTAGLPYRINLSFFTDFIRELARQENYRLLKMYEGWDRTCRPREGEDDDNSTTADNETPPEEREMTDFQHRYYYEERHPQYESTKYMFNNMDFSLPDKEWKELYYSHFFGLPDPEQDANRYNRGRFSISQAYFQSLLFTLNYYLDEVPSWNWHYPHRVAPIPSDLLYFLTHHKNPNMFYVDGGLGFKKGRPYRPFEQLMMVLPPQNKILPRPYIQLMGSPQLRDSYPSQFPLDIVAGEKYIYSEAILPPVNVSQLLSEMKRVDNKLTHHERARNGYTHRVFVHDGGRRHRR